VTRYQYPDCVAEFTTTIANTATTTVEIDLGGAVLMAIALPAAFTTTAATLTFEVASASGGTYQPLYDENGNLVTVSGISQGRTYSLGRFVQMLAPFRFIKIVAGTAQAAERTLTLFARPV